MEYACDFRRLDIVSLLISHFGHTILTDNQTPSGDYCHEDPLLLAVRANNLALTTLLLEAGASPIQTVWYGYPISDKSPLDCAGKYGSAPVAEILIKYGAEVKYASRSLSYAVRHENWDVARVLLRGGVHVWEPNYEWAGRAPLGDRSPEEIEAWLDAGASYMEQCRESEMARYMKKRCKGAATSDAT